MTAKTIAVRYKIAELINALPTDSGGTFKASHKVLTVNLTDPKQVPAVLPVTNNGLYDEEELWDEEEFTLHLQIQTSHLDSQYDDSKGIEVLLDEHRETINNAIKENHTLDGTVESVLPTSWSISFDHKDKSGFMDMFFKVRNEG